MFHPDDRERVKAFFKQIASGNSERAEFRYLTKSGEILTVMLRGKLLESGPLPGEGVIIGGMLDITDMKAIEIALRASEERPR